MKHSQLLSKPKDQIRLPHTHSLKHTLVKSNMPTSIPQPWTQGAYSKVGAPRPGPPPTFQHRDVSSTGITGALSLQLTRTLTSRAEGAGGRKTCRVEEGKVRTWGLEGGQGGFELWSVQTVFIGGGGGGADPI